MLYADDLILADISPAKLQERFSEGFTARRERERERES